MILLDTNVLVYAVDSGAPFHDSCHRVVSDAMAGRISAVLVPQVLMEFYAVVTSPRRVRSPLPAADAAGQVMDWRSAIPVRYPTVRCMEDWATLVQHSPRTGQEVHDLFLAAQMRAHTITQLCTVNTRDFVRIPGIEAVHPDQLQQGPAGHGPGRNLVVEFKEAQAEASKLGHDVEYQTGDGVNVQTGACTLCGRRITVGYPTVNECLSACTQSPSLPPA